MCRAHLRNTEEACLMFWMVRDLDGEVRSISLPESAGPLCFLLSPFERQYFRRSDETPESRFLRGTRTFFPHQVKGLLFSKNIIGITVGTY